MEIFINEQSLHSQYFTKEDFKLALLTMIDSFNALKDLKSSVLRCEMLYLMSPIKDATLAGLLKSNSDLSFRFKDALQKNNVKSWEISRSQLDNVIYKYLEEICNGFSIAELTERKYQNQDFLGFLLNFQNSKYGNLLELEINRDNDIISVDCTYDAESITKYLLSHALIDESIKYNENLRIAPTDKQTILGNEALFEKTTYPKNNGRTVYRKKGTNQLWTVDGSTKHATVKAHIEVFDENTRKHLGTSLYNEDNLNIEYKEPERTITLS